MREIKKSAALVGRIPPVPFPSTLFRDAAKANVQFAATAERAVSDPDLYKVTRSNHTPFFAKRAASAPSRVFLLGTDGTSEKIRTERRSRSPTFRRSAIATDPLIDHTWKVCWNYGRATLRILQLPCFLKEEGGKHNQFFREGDNFYCALKDSFGGSRGALSVSSD